MKDVDVARDDLALDALAAGGRPDGGGEVLGLLHALRTDLDAAAAGPAAPRVMPLRPRRRPFGLAALSAAAGLVLGALAAGAVVAADRPGQLLYAAHEALLGDPKDAERVTRLLDDAAEALAEGDRREALRRLDSAAERVGDVADRDERAALVARLGRLRAIAAAPTAGPTPTPTASPSADDDDRTPEPTESETPDGDDNSGKGSSSSGSGSSGSGSDDSRSDSSGKGSDGVLRTLDPDGSGGSGGGSGGESDGGDDG